MLRTPICMVVVLGNDHFSATCSASHNPNGYTQPSKSGIEMQVLSDCEWRKGRLPNDRIY